MSLGGRPHDAPRLTLRQRLGLARAELPREARHALVIGRAGAALFAWEATFAVGAVLAQGDYGAQAPVLLAAAWSYAIGVLVLVGYDRVGERGLHVLAAACGAIVTSLVVTAPGGELYAWLYILPVFFVSFFLRPVHAGLHIGAMIASFGAATMLSVPLRDALHAWILGTGALLGSAALVVVLRGRLSRVVASRTAALERERESRSLLDAFFANAPAALSFLDTELRYIRVNEAFAYACGVDADHVIGRTVRDVWPTLADEIEPHLLQVLESGQAVVGEELSGEAPPAPGGSVTGSSAATRSRIQTARSSASRRSRSTRHAKRNPRRGSRSCSRSSSRRGSRSRSRARISPSRRPPTRSRASRTAPR